MIRLNHSIPLSLLALAVMSDCASADPKYDYLSSMFSQAMECGYVDYLNRVRISHACCYLEQNYLKTYEIAYKVGFRDEKYFSKVFKKIKGMSPKEYRGLKR